MLFTIEESFEDDVKKYTIRMYYEPANQTCLNSLEAFTEITACRPYNILTVMSLCFSSFYGVPLMFYMSAKLYQIRKQKTVYNSWILAQTVTDLIALITDTLRFGDSDLTLSDVAAITCELSLTANTGISIEWKRRLKPWLAVDRIMSIGSIAITILLIPCQLSYTFQSYFDSGTYFYNFSAAVQEVNMVVLPVWSFLNCGITALCLFAVTVVDRTKFSRITLKGYKKVALALLAKTILYSQLYLIPYVIGRILIFVGIREKWIYLLPPQCTRYLFPACNAVLNFWALRGLWRKPERVSMIRPMESRSTNLKNNVVTIFKKIGQLADETIIQRTVSLPTLTTKDVINADRFAYGRWKDPILQMVAGGSSGIIETFLLFPLDLVKTRLQTGNRDRGIVDCLKNTYRYEGFLGLYKGILPPLVVEIPKRMIRFVTFEQFKVSLDKAGVNPIVSLSLAGFGSGLMEAIPMVPFELVKVRQQTNRIENISGVNMTKMIIRNEGYGRHGIFRGFIPTLVRNGTYNLVYFDIYHILKDYVPDKKEFPNQNFAARMLIGFVAGALGCVANISMDVAKSRIQGPQPNAPGRKYYTLLQSIRLIYKEEGLRALHKGLGVKMLRLGPGGAITLVFYENAYEWLKKNT